MLINLSGTRSSRAVPVGRRDAFAFNGETKGAFSLKGAGVGPRG